MFAFSKTINHLKEINLLCTKLLTFNLSTNAVTKCNIHNSLINKSSIKNNRSFNGFSLQSVFQQSTGSSPGGIIGGFHYFSTSDGHRNDEIIISKEFFDDKKNWGQNEVKHGRSWTLDELRIKSNMDLHKLWFVLLKERNMLMTMEHECLEKVELFPSAERIDKVKISMVNLEKVVRERNKAYHMLETGIDGERPGKLVYNQLGQRIYYRFTEHIIPKYMNKKWKETHKFGFKGHAVSKFRGLMREKLHNDKRKARNRDRNHVMHLLRRFPNMDKEMLTQKYPKVNINKLVQDDKCRGHFESS